MGEERIDPPPGTLDLLIQRTLAVGPQHGWAISERVQQVSSDVLRIQQVRCIRRSTGLSGAAGLNRSGAHQTTTVAPKYYELTRSGQKQLDVETKAWRRLMVAVGHSRENVRRLQC